MVGQKHTGLHPPCFDSGKSKQYACLFRWTHMLYLLRTALVEQSWIVSFLRQPRSVGDFNTAPKSETKNRQIARFYRYLPKRRGSKRASFFGLHIPAAYISAHYTIFMQFSFFVLSKCLFCDLDFVVNVFLLILRLCTYAMFYKHSVAFDSVKTSMFLFILFTQFRWSTVVVEFFCFFLNFHLFSDPFLFLYEKLASFVCIWHFFFTVKLSP